METTRLSSKGQVVLPKSVREAHGLQSGAVFAVEARVDGILLRPLVEPFARTRIQDVLGCTGYTGPRRSLEEMEQAIAKGVMAGRRGGIE